jgi:aspartate/methionine/tyrosine aminotransferase
MKLEPLDLEVWLGSPRKYDLGSGGITRLKLKDIVDALDPDLVITCGKIEGSDQIRERVASLFRNVEKNQVLITNATSEANFLALYRLLEKEDEVVTLLPSYMQCAGLARSLGVKVKNCALQEEENYGLNLEDMKRLVTKKTKVIYIVNPNNPTGSIVFESEMKAICEIAEDSDSWVLCDGAMRGLEIDGNPSPSSVEIYPKGIATGSLSKMGLPGLRIGWMIADERLVEDCAAYKDYTTQGHSGIGEYLATIALEKKNVQRYLERARSMIREHSEILSQWISNNHHFSWVPPKAGHTAFVKYDLDLDSAEFCRRLLQEESVLIGPGDFFGSPEHLRVRYSCEKQELIEGLKRLGEFLARLSKR